MFYWTVISKYVTYPISIKKFAENDRSSPTPTILVPTTVAPTTIKAGKKTSLLAGVLLYAMYAHINGTLSSLQKVTRLMNQNSANGPTLTQGKLLTVSAMH